jgi:hypothetical protein
MTSTEASINQTTNSALELEEEKDTIAEDQSQKRLEQALNQDKKKKDKKKVVAKGKKTKKTNKKDKDAEDMVMVNADGALETTDEKDDNARERAEKNEMDLYTEEEEQDLESDLDVDGKRYLLMQLLLTENMSEIRI